MAQEWYYTVDGKQHGPVDARTLISLANAGKVQRTDRVWTEKLGKWVPAGHIKELFPIETAVDVPTGMAAPPVIGSGIIPPPVRGSAGEEPPTVSLPSIDSETPPIFDAGPPVFGATSTTNFMQKSKSGLDTVLSTVKRTKELAAQKLKMENINLRLLPETFYNIGKKGYGARVGEMLFPALFAELDAIRLRIEVRGVQTGNGANQSLVDKTLEAVADMTLDTTDKRLFNQKLKELGDAFYSRRDQFHGSVLQADLASVDEMILERDALKKQLDGSGDAREAKKNRMYLIAAGSVTTLLCLMILYYASGVLFGFGGSGQISRVKNAVVYQELNDSIQAQPFKNLPESMRLPPFSNKAKTMTFGEFFNYWPKVTGQKIKIEWGTKADSEGRKIVYCRLTGAQNVKNENSEFWFHVNRKKRVEFVGFNGRNIFTGEKGLIEDEDALKALLNILFREVDHVISGRKPSH